MRSFNCIVNVFRFHFPPLLSFSCLQKFSLISKGIKNLKNLNNINYRMKGNHNKFFIQNINKGDPLSRNNFTTLLC